MRAFLVFLVLVGVSFVVLADPAAANPVPSPAVTDCGPHYPRACDCPPQCGAPYPYYRPYYYNQWYYCRTRYHYRPPWGCQPCPPRRYYRAGTR